MAILSFFKRHPPILFRCSECNDEKTLTLRQLRLVAKLGLKNPICPFLIPCPSCHRGFFAPVDYTDAHGNRFTLDQIKKRIFIDHEAHTTFSFKFED
jgi:hypothetical protein